jgi:hypothetical protein
MGTRTPIRLLFEEMLQECFNVPETKLERFKDWIKQANNSRDTGNLEAFPNQYDKAEELITFYTFAPLMVSLNRVGLTNRILGLAGISPYEENVVSVGLEKPYPPPTRYLSWLKSEINNHPVKYIREQAKNHIANNKPLESKTQVDAYIETDKLLIFFEIKFTSDISCNTTFNSKRNQLARLIDVGLKAVRLTGKELLVILSTPSRLYENGSRLYYYKVNEYSDPLKIKDDIVWRPLQEIKDNVLAVKWIALEDLISLFYRDFKHPQKAEALDFFRERLLA